MKQHDLTRGCLKRKPGGSYLVTNIERYKTDFDVPYMEFMYDPIPRLSDFDVRMSPQELAVVPAFDGRQTCDVWDWVGAGSHPADEGYWNVLDYWYEGVKFEFSTYVSKTFIKAHASQLSSKSKLIKVFPHVPRSPQMWLDRVVPCPKGIEDHAPNGDLRFFTCAGLLWETINGGTELEGRKVRRDFPPKKAEFSYEGYEPPVDPEYEAGPVLWLPLQSWEVIWAPDDAHKKAIELLNRSGNQLPFKVVNE